MIKKIFVIIFIFIAGGFGGALFSSLFAKTFAKIPLLSKVSYYPQDQTVIVNKTEEVIVEQSTVIKKAIDRNLSAIVTVRSFRDDTLLASGTGFIVGADGLVLTRRELTSDAANKLFIEKEGRTFSAKLLKKDDVNGLVLLKSDSLNLPVVSFSDSGTQNIGEFVFLLGARQSVGGTPTIFVNVGIIKSVDSRKLETNIEEDFKLATGTPLINASGDVVGISAVDSSGYVFAISSQAIKDFVF